MFPSRHNKTIPIPTTARTVSGEGMTAKHGTIRTTATQPTLAPPNPPEAGRRKLRLQALVSLRAHRISLGGSPKPCVTDQYLPLLHPGLSKKELRRGQLSMAPDPGLLLSRGGEGGRGFWTQNLVYQKWPDQIFPIVNFGFSRDGHFGLGRGGGGFGGGVPPCLGF